MATPQNPSLLAFFAEVSRCQFISDLRYLDEDSRYLLSHAAACLPTESYSLAEWNDALNYLASMPPQKDREIARYLLTKALRGEAIAPNISQVSGKILQFAPKR